ncbi:MAG: Protein-L-isoaspartate O-methyltransferase [Planctomycetaceae bacterium]|nr:Protein-L-isoaspartate O-methyltransferase [Planctomycetaceae bacterium]
MAGRLGQFLGSCFSRKRLAHLRQMATFREMKFSPTHSLATLAAILGIGVIWVSTPVIAQGKKAVIKRPEDKRFAAERATMVDKYLAAEGITNEAVLQAARTVPRHIFVKPEFRARAYFDTALPIDHKQTISPPFIVAYMTQVLDPQKEDKVLEIGTGSGYQAAILGQIVKEVYTIEIVEPLSKLATERLKDLGYSNIYTRFGDGFKGWPEAAPFDKIIVTCSPEKVPQPLIDQLKDGGRMIVPLGERYQQVFYLFEKKDGKLVQQRLVPTLFVPMTGKSEELRTIKPDPLHPRIRNGSFELINAETGTPENWHYQRQMKLMAGGAPDGQHFVNFDNTDPGRFSQCIQAMALDGRAISAVNVTVAVKGTQLRPGNDGTEQASLVLNFFDDLRKPIGQAHIGPWQGTFDWQEITKELAIPIGTKECIMHVGLSGGVGSLGIDNIRLVPIPR